MSYSAMFTSGFMAASQSRLSATDATNTPGHDQARHRRRRSSLTISTSAAASLKTSPRHSAQVSPLLLPPRSATFDPSSPSAAAAGTGGQAQASAPLAPTGRARSGTTGGVRPRPRRMLSTAGLRAPPPMPNAPLPPLPTMPPLMRAASTASIAPAVRAN